MANAAFSPRGPKLSKDVRAKIQALRSFLPSGNLVNDYNYFLQISGRQFFYKKGTAENADTLLDILKKMKDSWEESQKEQGEEVLSEEEKIFYKDIPAYEIEAVSRIIDFYEDKH